MRDLWRPDRRSVLGWIGSSAVLSGLSACQTATPSIPSPAGQSDRLSSVGIQVFTIRSLFADDPKAALRLIAQSGFDKVEFGGPEYLKMSPEDLGLIKSETGLRSPSMHVRLGDAQTELPSLIHYAKALNVEYIVVPSLPKPMRETIDGFKEASAVLNEAGRRVTDAGLRFAYHNHAFEFDDLGGTTGWQILETELDPAYVGWELDFYWLARAQQDIQAMMKRHEGRVWLCHAKDIAADGETIVTPGEGILDFATLFSEGREAGLEHVFMEYDRLEPARFESVLREGCDHLKSLRF